MALLFSNSGRSRVPGTRVRPEACGWLMAGALIAVGGGTTVGAQAYLVTPRDVMSLPLVLGQSPGMDGIVGRWCRPSNGSCTERDPQLHVEAVGQGYGGILRGLQDRNGGFVSLEDANPYSLEVRHLTVVEEASTSTRTLYRGEVFCDRWPEVNGDKSRINGWASIAIQYYSPADPVLPPGPRIDISWGCSWIQPPGMVPFRK
jgi:hypothetical protein